MLIQSGSGIQACIETIGTIARITENVETMQMLARDGTLEGTGDPFSNHREDMSGKYCWSTNQNLLIRIKRRS